MFDRVLIDNDELIKQHKLVLPIASSSAEARYKRSVAELEAIAEEEAAANEIFGGGGKEGDCQSKYVRCLAAAFKTGAEHAAEPGGIAG